MFELIAKWNLNSLFAGFSTKIVLFSELFKRVSRAGKTGEVRRLWFALDETVFLADAVARFDINNFNTSAI